MTTHVYSTVYNILIYKLQCCALKTTLQNVIFQFKEQKRIIRLLCVIYWPAMDNSHRSARKVGGMGEYPPDEPLFTEDPPSGIFSFYPSSTLNPLPCLWTDKFALVPHKNMKNFKFIKIKKPSYFLLQKLLFPLKSTIFLNKKSWFWENQSHPRRTFLSTMLLHLLNLCNTRYLQLANKLESTNSPRRHFFMMFSFCPLVLK